MKTQLQYYSQQTNFLSPCKLTIHFYVNSVTNWLQRPASSVGASYSEKYL